MGRKLKVTIRKPKPSPASKVKSGEVLKRQLKKRSTKA